MWSGSFQERASSAHFTTLGFVPLLAIRSRHSQVRRVVLPDLGFFGEESWYDRHWRRHACRVHFEESSGWQRSALAIQIIMEKGLVLRRGCFIQESEDDIHLHYDIDKKVPVLRCSNWAAEHLERSTWPAERTTQNFYEQWKQFLVAVIAFSSPKRSLSLSLWTIRTSWNFTKSSLIHNTPTW